MGQETYTALIGDLVGSSESPSRLDDQRVLLRVLDELNQGLDGLAAPLTITAGDELQGLFASGRAGQAAQALRAISDALAVGRGRPRRRRGHRIRFGLGHGALTTPLPEDAAAPPPNPALLDGPAFHAARTALDRARDEGLWVLAAGFRLAAEPADRPALHDTVLSSCFEMLSTIRDGWTETQAHYVQVMRDELQRRGARDELPRGARQAVAESEDKDPSVITKSLQASAFETVLRAEAAIGALLDDYERRLAQGGAA